MMFSIKVKIMNCNMVALFKEILSLHSYKNDSNHVEVIELPVSSYNCRGTCISPFTMLYMRNVHIARLHFNDDTEFRGAKFQDWAYLTTRINGCQCHM